MRIYQPRREELVVQIVRFVRIASACARVDAGDQVADNADIRLADLTSCHINNTGVGEQQVKRGFASGSLYGPASGFGSHAINRFSIQILTLLYAPGKRLPS